MELRALVRALAKQWHLIAALTLSVFAVTAVVSMTAAPQYQATARLYVTMPSAGASAGELLESSGYIENQIATYREVVYSSHVLAPVIDRLGSRMSVEELGSTLSVAVPDGTTFMDVTARSGDPTLAAQTADAVGEQVVATVTNELSTPESSPVLVEVFERAVPPDSPTSPDIPRNLVLGLALGLMLGVAVALLRDALDTRIRDEEDALRVTSGPVLGVIPALRRRDREHGALYVAEDPTGMQAEGVRRLRTNLTYVDLMSGIDSMVITSSAAGEGKSSVALNLAQSMADSGVRTLLVDADLRHPSLASYLGLEGEVGLTTVLEGRVLLENAVREWGPSGLLFVLPSGALPPNPSELLGSEAMRDLVARSSETYDLVVFDAPPVQPVTDTVVLGKQAAGVLVVVEAGKTREAHLKKSIEALGTVRANVIGIVLNKVRGAGVRSGRRADAYEAERMSGRTVARRGVWPAATDAPSTPTGDEASTPARMRS